VLDEVPDARFVVIGDGRDREALGLVTEAVRGRIDLRGVVPNDRIPAYHAACEAFVSSATGQESFGISLVEAMASGLPVVATDIPGYREVVTDGVEGLLVPARDPEALAAGLVRVLTEPALAARLGEAGRERARSFDWPLVVDRLEALYHRAAESAGYDRSR
jgi:phosphatidylinositol alpha-mannosyltransferase